MKNNEYPVWESSACKDGRKITVQLEKEFRNEPSVKYGYTGSHQSFGITLEQAMAIHHAVAYFINSGVIKEGGAE